MKWRDDCTQKLIMKCLGHVVGEGKSTSTFRVRDFWLRRTRFLISYRDLQRFLRSDLPLACGNFVLGTCDGGYPGMSHSVAYSAMVGPCHFFLLANWNNSTVSTVRYTTYKSIL